MVILWCWDAARVLGCWDAGMLGCWGGVIHTSYNSIKKTESVRVVAEIIPNTGIFEHDLPKHSHRYDFCCFRNIENSAVFRFKKHLKHMPKKRKFSRHQDKTVI